MQNQKMSASKYDSDLVSTAVALLSIVSTSASTFSSLPEAQRVELSRKADELVGMKLFADKLSALKSLLPQGVTFP